MTTLTYYVAMSRSDGQQPDIAKATTDREFDPETVPLFLDKGEARSAAMHLNRQHRLTAAPRYEVFSAVVRVGMEEESQTLYACQKCGEEFAEGEADHNGRHAYCGGQGDPIGDTGSSEEGEG